MGGWGEGLMRMYEERTRRVRKDVGRMRKRKMRRYNVRRKGPWWLERHGGSGMMRRSFF